jgi:hypothetical protein
MLKTVILVLLVLATGPVAAVLMLMAGCSGRHPLFGGMCGHNAPVTLLLLLVMSWIALIGFAVFRLRGHNGGPARKSMTMRRRRS